MLKKLIKISLLIILILGIYNSYTFMKNQYKFYIYQECLNRLFNTDMDKDIALNICLNKTK